MNDIQRISTTNIKADVSTDLLDRTIEAVDKLKKFYYNIVTEGIIRTSSFRYHYAHTALLVICDTFNDTETPNNLARFHREKVQFELKNPIEKVKLETNQVTKEQKYGTSKIDKSASPMKI